MVYVWQKKFSGNLFGYVRHVEEWLFDGWNFVIPTDVGILCYWQRCRNKFSMTKPRHSDAYRNLMLLAEMPKQVRHDCHCHSDGCRNLMLLAKMLK